MQLSFARCVFFNKKIKHLHLFLMTKKYKSEGQDTYLGHLLVLDNIIQFNRMGKKSTTRWQCDQVSQPLFHDDINIVMSSAQQLVMMSSYYVHIDLVASFLVVNIPHLK